MLEGSCLCNAVRFTIDGNVSDIGYCHCSKCRKVSGTASNAVLITARRSFTWVAGEEAVKTFAMRDGWTSTFCPDCGSPLPMEGAGGKLVWVPAGLLDHDPGVGVAQHIFVDSKASWDIIGGDAEQYAEEAPDQARV